MFSFSLSNLARGAGAKAALWITLPSRIVASR